VSARAEAWEGKNPGSVRVLLANPRWERRFVRFLELSGVGRTMADGTDEDGARAARTDEWVVWGGGRRDSPQGRRLNCHTVLLFLFLIKFVSGYSCPRDLRTAHCGGRRISFVVTVQPRAGSGLYFPFVRVDVP